MKRFSACSLFFALAISLHSCDKEPVTYPVTAQGTIQVDANSYTDWVYFSFESGSIVTPADPATSLDWDIAFHMWDVRTNSGTSGAGQGGAYRPTGELTALLDESVIPRNELFVVDGTIRTFMSTPSMRPGAGIEEQKVNEPGSTMLAAWIDVSLATMPPVITFEPSVWWVRRADGGYALVQFTDYLDDAGTAFKFYPKFNYWLK